MGEFFYTNLARAAGLSDVYPGDQIDVEVDLVLGHDGTGPKLLKAWNHEEQIFDGRRVLFTVDHAFPAPTVQERAFQKDFAAFCKNNGCVLYNHGEGVLHQVVAERASLWPGMIVAGADGHVATSGAFSAIAFALTPEELVPVLKNGRLRLKVPMTLTIELTGELLPSVLPRDVALYLANKLEQEIQGKAVILTGEYLRTLSPAGRMTICNFLPEVGAMTALVLPENEQATIQHTFDLNLVERMLAIPSAPTLIKTVDEVSGTSINVAIIGGCSSGRLEDMEVVADVLRNAAIHPDVSFIVTPASSQVAGEMDKKGISSLLRERGAVIMPPGCGPCPGKHFGVLAPGDVAITTTIRNSPGRIGSSEAQIYLASPLTVAKAAVQGKI